MRKLESIIQLFMTRKIKNILLLSSLVAILSFFSSATISAEDNYSRSAANEGYMEISKFRDVFIPLWEKAYPARDYDALISATYDIDSATNTVYGMLFKTRFADRMSAFKERKHNLLKTVADYVKAAQNNDSATVYQLFPQIHSDLESLAEILLPFPYPHLEKLIVRAKYLSDSLIKKGDILEMAKATDTVIAGIQGLSSDSLPKEVLDKANLAAEEFAYFNKLSMRLKDALVAKDMAKFRLLAMELSVRLVNFRYIYLL